MTVTDVTIRLLIQLKRFMAIGVYFLFYFAVVSLRGLHRKYVDPKRTGTILRCATVNKL